MAVNPIPKGYERAVPYLCCSPADKAIDFYQRAFGATELMRMPGPDGKIGHAEIKIGESIIMLADEHPAMDGQEAFKSPLTLGGSPMFLMIYVPDVDATFKQAVAAGGTISREIENQFYGDRSGAIKDPFGHTWYFATHVEDVPPEEMGRRAAELSRQSGG
jgi:PhnB protein